MNESKLNEVINGATKTAMFVAYKSKENANRISKRIAKKSFPKILKKLFNMRKNKIIKATDSDIIRCARKQSNYYGNKAEKHILRKVIKASQDTIFDAFDEKIN